MEKEIFAIKIGHLFLIHLNIEAFPLLYFIIRKYVEKERICLKAFLLLRSTIEINRLMLIG